jgi:hypothetical protein
MTLKLNAVDIDVVLDVKLVKKNNNVKFLNLTIGNN